MGETLKRRVGFLPIWAWGLLLVVVLALYLSYRKKQAAAAAAAQAANQNSVSSNLGTVPVSNLTTAASPMPIQMGDTFVNTTVPVSPTTTTTINNPPPPATTTQPAPPPAPAPVVKSTAGKAYGLVNTVQGLMYFLGVNTKGSQIYNVSGGAPVYFGNASALAQGAQYEQVGQDIYTPVGYGGQIASTPVALQNAYT